MTLSQLIDWSESVPGHRKHSQKVTTQGRTTAQDTIPEQIHETEYLRTNSRYRKTKWVKTDCGGGCGGCHDGGCGGCT